jgi:hypothetical protein
MNRRTIMATATALAASAALIPAAAGAAGSDAGLTIRHQLKGCHEWSLNGGKYAVKQVVKLPRGGSLTITDNDMMPHQLTKLSGPAVKTSLVKVGSLTMGKMKAPYAVGLMPHMGATVKVTFTKAGTYTFRTRSLEDYMPIKTVGEDNTLRVTVIVS